MSQTKTSNRTNLAPLAKNDSQSSDYFDDDPGFAEALATLDDHTLFGSQPLTCLDNVSGDLGDGSKPASQGRKRKRSRSPAPGRENSQEDILGNTPSPEQPSLRNDSTNVGESKICFPTIDPGDSTPKLNTYGASKFGGFGDYMRRKRAKLQNQNTDLSSQDRRSSQTTLFKSLAIYITGRTNPSLQVLRALIIQHGGEFHAYLDRKEMVTHVVTSNLTPAKALEFKHMKVVRPEWLVDSVAANKLLPWSDYRWVQQPDGSTQSLAPQTPIPTPSLPPQSSPVRPATSPKSLDIDGNSGGNLACDTPSSPGSAQPQTNNEQSGKSPPLPAIPAPRIIATRRSNPPLLMPPPPAPSGPSRPSYAAHKSNPEAERLMKSAEWRENHTSVSGETFIQGYYQHSRLHHLSKWKAELRNLVAKAQEDAESQISNEAGPRVLSVEALGSRQKGKGKGRASEKTIPYEFDRYKELSLKFYTILMGLSDDLQAVSVDEALIEVTSAVEALRTRALESGRLQTESYEKQMAESIRDKVLSIGIGPNIMLARLATKSAKPAGSFYLSVSDASAYVAELDIVNLHGFAGAVRDKAILSFGTSKLGDLAGKSKDTLQRALGDKSGERIWNAIRGIDDRALESDKPRKSVSADVNYGIRFENNEHAEKFIYGLGKEVSDRLKVINKRGRTLTLKIMKRHPEAPKEAPKFMGHGKCETFNKTCSISGRRGSATDDPNIIGREAWKLLQAMAFDPTELRGVGIQIQKLDEADGPRSAVQGQLAMRFQQAGAKANADKPVPPKNPPQKAPAPLVPQVTIIDVDALDDEQLVKPPPGRKETPYDLTMLSQLDENGVAQVMNGGTDRARSFSVPRVGQPMPGSSKAASLSPRRAQGRKRLTNMGPPTTMPNRSQFFPIFRRQLAPIPDQELVSLDIDPIAYAKMTREQQKAIVFTRRTAKGLDGAGRPIYKRKRRFQEPPSDRVYKTVQAVKVELPTLRAAKPGTPAVTETDDVQDMMRAWVETKVAKKLGPDPREVAHFSTFLEKSMATDRGMQRTVEVMKWWRHVCMSSWGPDDERHGRYGREWWVAWWDTKDKLDAIVKRRFGGKLNLN
ncbi:deoxycytidyl transferase [Ceratobasidium sp. 370]|nr:deoxycytidyl transferase [Ceratobasidium sp. 370]